LIVAGGGGFGGDIWANRIFANGAEVVTTGTIGAFGISNIIAGTDTSVAIGLGNVATIWNTSTLQSVTARGSITTSAISITNSTPSTASNTGSLILSAGAGIAGNLYVGGGTLGLDNGTSNTISFSAVGTGAPAFTTRSAGTKLLLYSAISGSQVDYAIGIEAATLWSSVPVNSNSFNFKWYGGTTQVANLSGDGAFSANSLYDNSNRVLTSVTPTAGTAISISSVSTSGSNTAFTINNEGVITAVGTTYLGVSSSVGNVTFTNLGVQTVTGSAYIAVSTSTGTVTISNNGVQTLTAGTDTAVSSSTGTVTVWNVSTLQSVTGRGASTNQAISISNTSSSTATTGGALTVTGGVGIGENLNIGGALTVQGAATFSSPVVFNGTATYVYSTNTFYTDNLIELHTTSTGVNTEWTFSDGKDIGLRFHYYNKTLATGTNAALVLADDSQFLEWYSTGVENASGIFTGTAVYGIFKTGAVHLTSSEVNGQDATSGALQVAGGVGILKTTWIGGNGGIASHTAVGQQGLIVNFNGMGINGDSFFTNTLGIGQNLLVTGTSVLTGSVETGGLLTVGGEFTASGTTRLIGAATASSTFGVRGDFNVTGTTLLSGAATAASTLGVIGDFNVTGTTTLSGLTRITNGTQSAATNSGALIVAGGAGFGGNVNVGGDIFVQGVINATVVGSISTATNIAAGASGSIPYQTAFGRTSFFGPGTAGDLLVSSGGSTPTFVNTMTLAGPTQAVNTLSGALQVRGGVGIGKNLYVGGDIYTLGQMVITTATVNNYANQTFLFAGTDTAVSTSTGNIYVWNTSTLQSITNRGATTNNAISIANTTASTGTDTGALIVNGGAGFGKDVWIGGNLNVDGDIFLQGVGLNSINGTTATFDNVYVTGVGTGIAITNNATIGGNLTATTLNVTSQSTLQNVTADVTTVTTLTVTGNETVNGNLGVAGNVNTTGTTTLIGAVYADGNVGVKGNVSTTGTVYVGSDLGVQGTISSTGTAYFGSDVGVQGKLNVTGTTVLSTLTITNTLNVGSTTTFVKSIIVGPASQYKSYQSLTTSTTDILVIDTFDSTFYRTVKYLVQVVDTGYTPNRVQVEEFLVFHDNNGSSTLVDIIQYAVGSNTGALGEFDAVYAAGEITIQFTPAFTPTALTVKTVRTAVTV
jgi:hypothetical protein